jgi:hypothetical protein
MKVYPNPTAGHSVIEYYLPENSFVNLEIMNSVGQQMCQLINEQRSQGTFRIDLDLTSADYSTGIYLLKLRVNDRMITQRMILTK